jgi:hypothetical protein
VENTDAIFVYNNMINRCSWNIVESGVKHHDPNLNLQYFNEMGYNILRNIVHRKTLQILNAQCISVNKSVKDTRIIGVLDFTQWKAQVCDKYILLSERLKYVTIRFYSEKGSSM